MKQTGSQNRSRVTGGRPKGRLMAAALLLTVAFMGIVPATSSAVDPSFVPVLIAGGGVLGHGTDGSSAVCVSEPGCATNPEGRIMYPIGMAVHPTSGEFFFSQGSLENTFDLNNDYRSIRRIEPNGTLQNPYGTLQTVVGDNVQDSECKSNCDGAVTTSAQQLRTPGHMVFNSNGSALYVLDGENGVREVTFAGNPPLPTTISTRTYTSIPSTFTSSTVSAQGGLGIDTSGALYFGVRMQEPFRLSVMKLTSTGALTELISSVADKAPTMKVGSGQFNGPLDVKVVGDDLYVLYDNKLIRTDLDGTLEAEYTLQAEYNAPTQIHYKSFAVVGGTVYVGRTGVGFNKADGAGSILSFSDDASTSVAASPTLTPFIGTTSATTFSFNTDLSQIELTGPRSMMVHNGGLYISDMKSDSKFIEFSVILALMPPPVISPATQIVSGQVGTAIAASTGFTESNFSGAVTYSSETLPAGLTLDSDTGVISGTPTAVSTATVTITAIGATSGTATATVTFAISAAPTPPAPAEIVPPAPETTAPPTTAAPTTAAPGNAPTLVSADNQTALTRTPGSATALVNGQPVEVEVRALADSTGAQTAPEDRSPEQVAELQQAAVAVTDRLAAVAGGDIGIEVIATDTGAELSGVFPDMNIPVEDVIVVDVGESATLFAARSPSGDIIKVQPGAVLEVTPEGEVAVIAYGLPVGDQVELVLMSTPTLLGTFIVDASGAIEILANIPDAIGSGDHTLVVASPNVQASLGLTVSDLTQPSAMELPATGTSPANGLVIIMLAMGGLLVLATRRRNMRID